jgi:hypothetical protein
MSNVNLDWYYGRKVKEANKTEEGFEIVLEGDVVISSEDPDLALLDPEGVVDQVFRMSALSGDWTTLLFGPVDVTLNPNRYAITDPAFGNEQVYPQRSEVSPTPPPLPEHPDERVVDEPPEVESTQEPAGAVESDSAGTGEAEGSED